MGRFFSGRGLRALLAIMAAAVVTGAGTGVAGAVGGNSAATSQTLIERWNGTSWKKVSSPSPGSIVNVLSGVAATSAANAWAVGAFIKGTAFQTLIERWNGATWTQAPSPNPAGATRDNQLAGVAATSASNAWAVGSYVVGTASALTQTLIVRWNGTRWTQVSSPSPGGTANPDRLAGVAATSASNAWAVGSYTTGGGFRTLTLHWNGTTWKQVPSPNSGTASDANVLSGVAAISASDAWAVGTHASRTSAGQTLTLHWDGKTWTKVPSPNAGSGKNVLLAVAATSASNAWAVGFVGAINTDRTLVERWNGMTWAMVSSPNPGSNGNNLSAVAATSASNAWAVGSG